LGETALEPSHIEKAFKLWWPQLDAQLKKLPQDGSGSRPPRTERDILEEVLDLVRNQNRLSASVSQDERHDLIHDRVWKVMESINDTVDAVSSSWGEGQDHSFTMKGIDRTYKVILPADVPLDEVESRATAQIEKQIASGREET